MDNEKASHYKIAYVRKIKEKKVGIVISNEKHLILEYWKKQKEKKIKKFGVELN